jgi:hypothetical protein
MTSFCAASTRHRKRLHSSRAKHSPTPDLTLVPLMAFRSKQGRTHGPAEESKSAPSKRTKQSQLALSTSSGSTSWSFALPGEDQIRRPTSSAQGTLDGETKERRRLLRKSSVAQLFRQYPSVVPDVKWFGTTEDAELRAGCHQSDEWVVDPPHFRGSVRSPRGGGGGKFLLSTSGSVGVPVALYLPSGQAS